MALEQMEGFELAGRTVCSYSFLFLASKHSNSLTATREHRSRKRHS